MKDANYPEFKLSEGDCYDCVLYTEFSNSCNHINYGTDGKLYCIDNYKNGQYLCYKIKLTTILKEL